MAISSAQAACEEVLTRALNAARRGEAALHEAVGALPTPVYATDPDGRITYFNPASASFAGRTPAIGQDRWCVSWKLYDGHGRRLPHDQCPMATALRLGRPIRGVEAVAERPDGSRVNFVPYPTPLLDEDGNVRGGVNMLIDVTRDREVEHLKCQAQKCRRLARSIGDDRTAATLTALALDYEERVRQIERPN